MHTMIIDNVTEFATLAQEWDEALIASPQNGPFLRHSWLLAWWDAFGSGELRIIICREAAGGRMLGAMPLYRSYIGLLWRVPTLRLLGDRRVGGTGLGAFAAPGAEEAVAENLADVMLMRQPSWGALDLHPIAENDPIAAHIAKSLIASRQVSAMRSDDALLVRPRIALPATWDEYLHSCISSDQRRSIRRSRHHAEEIGASVEHILGEADLADAVDEALALHEARMRHVVSGGYATTPERRAFAHATCSAMMAEGTLRLAFLVVDGERVAVECQMRYGDTRYAMWTGSLDSRAADEVSKTLFGHMVQDAIEEGCATLDFGVGDQPYKQSWGVTDTVRFGALRAYSASLSGRAAHARDASIGLARGGFDALPAALRDPVWRLARGIAAIAHRR